jgi:mRNA-degrading endonuclease toxin of MazEF toxin-antitoxin module
MPTSTKLKEQKYYFPIEYKNTKYSVLISQLRTIDSKRLKKKIATLTTNEFNKLNNYSKEILFK